MHHFRTGLWASQGLCQVLQGIRLCRAERDMHHPAQALPSTQPSPDLQVLLHIMLWQVRQHAAERPHSAGTSTSPGESCPPVVQGRPALLP